MEQLTKKEFEYLCELVCKAWYYRKTSKLLNHNDQAELYLKLRAMEKLQFKEA